MDSIVFEPYVDVPQNDATLAGVVFLGAGMFATPGTGVWAGLVSARVHLNAGFYPSLPGSLSARIEVKGGATGTPHEAETPTYNILRAALLVQGGAAGANTGVLGTGLVLHAAMRPTAPGYLESTLVFGATMLEFPPHNAEAGFFDVRYTLQPYAVMSVGHYGVDLNEYLAAGDAATSGFIIQLRERLNIVGAPRSILHTAIDLQDALVLRDAVQIIWQVVLTEALELADSGESQRVLVANLIDRLVLADIATTTLDARVTLATVLALADSVGVAWLADLVEPLDVSDTLDARITALVAILEQLETTDTATASLVVLANVSEALVLADEGGSQLDANVALHEALELFGSIVLNGDVWSCWLINTESKGVARYTNYPFNSFAKAPWGGYVGATDTGLHMLDGDTDDGEPIHALIRSALTDFGSRHLKRVPNMYLGYTASGPMVLKVIHTSEQGSKVEDWYRVEPRPAGSVRESRFKVGRGIASVYLGFELVNVAGADFALDVVEWLPLRLDRRVR